jgi:hypothetical protein
MTDKQLRVRLQRLLRRASAALMLNRLLTFLLVNLILYILLLLLVIYANLPLLLLNLIVFSALALFPCYLLTPLPAGKVKLYIRRLDRHCLLESYLETRQAELKSYMLPELETLLTAMSGQGIAPRRFSRLNTKLLVALLACLACYQAGVFLRFDSFAWNFSAQDLKARTLSAGRGGEEDSPGRGEETAPGRIAPPEEIPLPRGEEESAAFRPEAERALDLSDLPHDATGARGLRRTASEESADSARAAGESEREGLTDPTARTATQAGGGGVESGETGEAGRGLNKAGSAGKGFLESPIEEYRAALRELEARGGSELAAGSLMEAAEAGAYPAELFREYTGGGLPFMSLDPMLARIQTDYLRLIDERF